jgi:predicted RNA-binding protein with RPS1 domain
MKDNQYGAPILLFPAENHSIELERIDLEKGSDSPYDEGWLQQQIDENPALIPVGDIDPIFGELIPVCRELRTSVGPLDNLYVNELGMLTLVECKLWRNPEARRKVVGQILDYAQEFSRMDYDDLVTRINSKTGRTGNSLYEIVSERVEGVGEKEFVDSVTRNLARGRFLLLVVGDGIRENVENISTILVQPRIIAKTVEVERAVIRIEGDATKIRASISSPEKKPAKTSSATRRGSITEQVFFEEIEEEFPGFAEQLKKLFQSAEQRGLLLDAGSSAMMVKSPDKQFNFLAFQRDGTIRNYGCGSSKLGKAYMQKLAELFDNTIVYEASNGFHSTVKNGDDTYLNVRDILGKQEQWFALIDSVQSELASD